VPAIAGRLSVHPLSGLDGQTSRDGEMRKGAWAEEVVILYVPWTAETMAELDLSPAAAYAWIASLCDGPDGAGPTFVGAARLQWIRNASAALVVDNAQKKALHARRFRNAHSQAAAATSCHTLLAPAPRARRATRRRMRRSLPRSRRRARALSPHARRARA
jgi:hypothetical protein